MNEKMLFDEVFTVLQYGIVNIGDMARNERGFEEQIEQCTSLIIEIIAATGEISCLRERVVEANELDKQLTIEGWSGETAVRLAHHATRNALDQVKNSDRLQGARITHKPNMALNKTT